MALPPRLVAVHPDLSRVGHQQAVGQFNEGRLAAAVGAKQAHDAPRLHGQSHAVQRHGGAEALDQPFRL